MATLTQLQMHPNIPLQCRLHRGQTDDSHSQWHFNCFHTGHNQCTNDFAGQRYLSRILIRLCQTSMLTHYSCLCPQSKSSWRYQGLCPSLHTKSFADNRICTAGKKNNFHGRFSPARKSITINTEHLFLSVTITILSFPCHNLDLVLSNLPKGYRVWRHGRVCVWLNVGWHTLHSCVFASRTVTSVAQWKGDGAVGC